MTQVEYLTSPSGAFCKWKNSEDHCYQTDQYGPFDCMTYEYLLHPDFRLAHFKIGSYKIIMTQKINVESSTNHT